MQQPIAPPGQDRLAALDVMRLLAALMVVGWHWLFGGVWARPYVHVAVPSLAWLGQYGFLGVQVFFVISGFVITLSLEGRGAADFATARFIRLYPAYWICGALTLLVRVLLGEAPFAPCPSACVLANATMFNGFFDHPVYVDPSYWTLELELRFYLMMALLILARGREYLFWAALGWMLLSIDGLVAQGHEFALFGFIDGPWAPFFGTGVMLSLVRRDGRVRHWLGFALGWVLAGFYVAQKVGSYAAWAVPTAFSPALAIALFSLFVAALLLIARNRVTMRASAFTAACGGMSYTVYLLHQALGILLINRLASVLAAAVVLPLVLLLVLLLGWLVWRFAERPLQRALRSRLARLGGRACDRPKAPA